MTLMKLFFTTLIICSCGNSEIELILEKNFTLKEYQIMDKFFLLESEKKDFNFLGYSFILRYDLNKDNYKEYFIALQKKGSQTAIAVIDPRNKKERILQTFYFDTEQIYIYKPKKSDQVESIAVAFKFSTELSYDIIYKSRSYQLVPILIDD